MIIKDFKKEGMTNVADSARWIIEMVYSRAHRNPWRSTYNIKESVCSSVRTRDQWALEGTDEPSEDRISPDLRVQRIWTEGVRLSALLGGSSSFVQNVSKKEFVIAKRKRETLRYVKIHFYNVKIWIRTQMSISFVNYGH
jgi:hypothetical protein